MPNALGGILLVSAWCYLSVDLHTVGTGTSPEMSRYALFHSCYTECRQWGGVRPIGLGPHSSVKEYEKTEPSPSSFQVTLKSSVDMLRGFSVAGTGDISGHVFGT